MLCKFISFSTLHFLLAALTTSVLTIPAALGSNIQSLTLNSRFLGTTKNLLVYVPESYEQSELHFPVIYLLHGFGASEPTWVTDLGLQAKADEIGLNALIVLPDGDRSAFLNSYESYFLEEIVPLVDSSFRTVSSPEGRALIGESAGGFAAMHLGLRNPELFGSLASHSGWVSILFDPVAETQLQEVNQRPGFEEWELLLGLDIAGWKAVDPYTLVEKYLPGELNLYFDSGMSDEFGFHEVAQQFKAQLDRLDHNYEYHAVPGGRHDDQYFASRILYSLRFHVSFFNRNGIYLNRN